jgi:hypothetical protein
MIGCKKSDDTAADPPLTSPGMQAKLDGTAVNYGIPNTEKQQSTDGTETIFISAFTADGNSVELSLSKSGGVTTGAYTSTEGAHIGVSDITDYYSTNKIVNITITAIDATHVVGSFTGEANNLTSGGMPKAVTEGKFYANF